ncbi:MAG: 2Fe-2S iron-sulfur cluster binding domain-containing protein [Saccharospirillaceae bacterium]|nr:2Fe-2S iron-sulfur cluster binding domain-containing protein [Pseudomonadales bacterium]NRB80794.1 2Fe-2S iron-sulfur cluster binding domain-containing protein [Saccharospirillaceae bacterium]
MKTCIVSIVDQTEIKAQFGDNLLTVLNNQKNLSKSACRNGNCRICRCRLILGVINYQNKIPLALSDKEQEQGWILPCISTIVGDIKITDLNPLKTKGTLK